MKLFTEPFDLDQIESVLQDDDFLSLAHFMTGREDNWRDALDQVAQLLAMFERSDRNDGPVYGIISLLIQRTEQLKETDKLLSEITSRLGLIHGVSHLREIKSTQFRRQNPEAWQSAKDKAWVAQYRQRQAR